MMQEEFAQWEAESTFPGYAYGLCASGFGADLVVEADLGASVVMYLPMIIWYVFALKCLHDPLCSKR